MCQIAVLYDFSFMATLKTFGKPWCKCVCVCVYMCMCVFACVRTCSGKRLSSRTYVIARLSQTETSFFIPAFLYNYHAMSACWYVAPLYAPIRTSHVILIILCGLCNAPSVTCYSSCLPTSVWCGIVKAPITFCQKILQKTDTLFVFFFIRCLVVFLVKLVQVWFCCCRCLSH